MHGDRGTTLAEALIMTALNEQRRDRRSLIAERWIARRHRIDHVERQGAVDAL